MISPLPASATAPETQSPVTDAAAEGSVTGRSADQRLAASVAAALMALDIGTKTIGIATSDALRMLATPLTTWSALKRRVQRAWIPASTSPAPIPTIMPSMIAMVSGRRMVKVVPWPRRLAMAIWPRSSSTVRATTSRPAAGPTRRRPARWTQW